MFKTQFMKSVRTLHQRSIFIWLLFGPRQRVNLLAKRSTLHLILSICGFKKKKIERERNRVKRDRDRYIDR